MGQQEALHLDRSSFLSFPATFSFGARPTARAGAEPQSCRPRPGSPQRPTAKGSQRVRARPLPKAREGTQEGEPALPNVV